jgi:hypothetical protein
MVVHGAVFNVLAITTHLLHGSPVEMRYVPISPGAFVSQEKVENNETSANYSYKVVDSRKRPYFLKEMSSTGLEDGDFDDVSDDEVESGAECCIKKSQKVHLDLPSLPGQIKVADEAPVVTKKKKPGLKLNLGTASKLTSKKKSLPIETIVENEVDSSNLAAFITDGLVPIAEPYEQHHKIVQEYIELDKVKSKKYFHAGTLDFKEWSDKDREQFFTHMLADLLLKNTDAHYQQFGVDTQGNIVGFDKGKANLQDRHSRSWDVPFGIPQLTLPESVVYGGYVDYLLAHKDELKKVLNSEIVNKAFERIETVGAKLDKNRTSPEFTVPNGENPVKFKKFYNSYSDRFRGLRADIHKYFDPHLAQ